MVPPHQAGYDAILVENGKQVTLKIKGRCILPGSKPGQRIGKIDVKKPFDAVLLVLIDEALDATAIYEADREIVLAALSAPGSKSRNERGALGVGKFKSIGKLVWSHASGEVIYRASVSRLKMVSTKREMDPKIWTGL